MKLKNILQNAAWNGLTIVDPFNTPEAVVEVYIDGVSSLGQIVSNQLCDRYLIWYSFPYILSYLLHHYNNWKDRDIIDPFKYVFVLSIIVRILVILRLRCKLTFMLSFRLAQRPKSFPWKLTSMNQTHMMQWATE